MFQMRKLNPQKPSKPSPLLTKRRNFHLRLRREMPRWQNPLEQGHGRYQEAQLRPFALRYLHAKAER